MKRRPRGRFYLASITSLITLGAALLTVVKRDWIEAVFGVDPDDGSGWLEWAIVLALFLATAAMAALARSEWSRAFPRPQSAE